MSVTPEDQWARFQKQYTWFESLGMGLDFSRTTLPDDYADKMSGPVERAFKEMQALEAGAIANRDESRMVGHYWLRNPALAPTQEIRNQIQDALGNIQSFAQQVHSGSIRGHTGTFKRILLIGIGGSALGPQFVSHALSRPSRDKLTIRFLDNTDPDGFDRVLEELQGDLGRTLCIVVSKSGGTKETRNAMVEVEAAYAAAGVPFGDHAVSITSQGSEMFQYAQRGKWLQQFPMWDWVGGRTSELSPVGLLPAALQGFDIAALLRGAQFADNATRERILKLNPAMQLALYSYYIGNGRGEKTMVVLPYKDRLELFSKYLQQLVMESLGKAQDRDGGRVNQGLTVFGNKGSTDQHAYVQQLREGLSNFFCLLIGVLTDRDTASLPVEAQATSGDYLTGFLLGTRDALFEKERESVLLTLIKVDEFRVGALIAIFERTVGYYASLINVNAYHQPGVEAGKKAATSILTLQEDILNWFRSHPNTFVGAMDLATAIGADAKPDLIFRICEHLSANGRVSSSGVDAPANAKFGLI